MKLFKSEPAVVIGVLVSVLTWVQQTVVQNQGLNWKQLIPVLTAAIIRQFVSPASA